MSTNDPQSNSTKNRLRYVALGVLVAVLVAGALLALLVTLDPFGWRVLDRLAGRYDSALTAVPADTRLYLGVNLLQADQELARIRDAYATALAGTDLDVETTQQDTNAALAEMFGISLQEDVRPWLGQYVGLALLDWEREETGNSAAWVLVAEARDRRRADQFLEKLRRHLAERQSQTAVTETYQGVTITAFSAGSGGLAFGRSGSLVLIGPDAAAVRRAVAAQRGNSLAEAAAFTGVRAQLPHSRFATVYINPEQLGDLAATAPLAAGLAGAVGPAASNNGTVIAVSLRHDGVLLDAFTVYDAASLSPAQRQALAAYLTEPQTAAVLPQQTLLYVAGQGIDLAWTAWREASAADADAADFAESMRLFAREFGLNPDTDLFPYLDGEAALALLPGAQGALAATLELNLEAVAVVRTGQPQALATTLDTFSESIGHPQTGLGTVTRSTLAGFTLHQFETLFFPGVRPVYGLGQDTLLLATSQEAIEALPFNGNDSLQASDGYQRAQSLVGAAPTLYVDVPALLAALADNTAALPGRMAVLRPISIIAATGAVNDNVRHDQILLLIE